MNNNLCPYCQAILNPAPIRKAECSSCGKDIYIRATQKIFTSQLLTEADARVADFYKDLAYMGVSDSDFFEMRQKLKIRFGFDPKSDDILWNLYNDFIMKHTSDYQSLKMVYHMMALYMNACKKDFKQLLEQRNRMELAIFARSGTKEVYISACGCKNCLEQNNKIFTIAEALQANPLPCIDCTTNLDNGHCGFCQCSYQPVTDFFRPQQ